MKMRPNPACIGLLCFLVWVSTASAADTHITAINYAIIERIQAPGTDWDYLSVDPAARHLYIAHNGVTALNLTTHEVKSHLVPGKITHGVLPLGNDLVAVDDSSDGTLTLFEGTTGKVHATLQIPRSSSKKGFHDPDALTLEPKTGLIVVVNGDSGELVLVDPRKPAVVGTIGVGGDLEFAAADEAGSVFVNVASTNEVAVVDVAERKVAARYPLKGCQEPTGLAFDALDGVVISVCDNGVVKFIAAKSGRDIRTLTVGKGPDAVLFDGSRRLAFVPSGESGTLGIIAVRSLTDIALVQTVPTQLGARTGALDAQTGRLYLPTARFKPPTKAFPFPSAIEGTFEILVLAPK
jgi:DNA-binding beta-propeller fold protein YncE